MSRRYGIALSALLFASSFAAFAQGKGAADSNRWGLLLDCKNLLALNGFEDGYQAGAGAKFWATPSIAARALARIDHNTPPEESTAPATTVFGLGFAGEWHPAQRAAASPYVGGLTGFRTLAEEGRDTRVDFYAGALAGVEVKLLGSISCFAEYQLLAAWDADGFTLSLGTEGSDGSRVLVGLIFYF